MRDAWRLALGTFTALRVGPPRHVDADVLGAAMLLAPVAALPASLTWVGLGLLAGVGVLPAAVAAALALVAAALLSRALHLDGLADLADGLTSGHDPARSLEVMRRGDTGPAGAGAVVLTLLLDAACLKTLFATPSGTSLAVTALVAGRRATGAGPVGRRRGRRGGRCRCARRGRRWTVPVCRRGGSRSRGGRRRDGLARRPPSCGAAARGCDRRRHRRGHRGLPRRRPPDGDHRRHHPDLTTPPTGRGAGRLPPGISRGRRELRTGGPAPGRTAA